MDPLIPAQQIPDQLKPLFREAHGHSLHVTALAAA
jgi:hypothetical protein